MEMNRKKHPVNGLKTEGIIQKIELNLEISHVNDSVKTYSPNVK